MPQNASDLSDQDLRDGQVFWATVDSPWLHRADSSVLEKGLDGIRKVEPSMILSSDLRPASGEMTEQLLASLSAARTAQPFVGPDQAALEEMLAQMTGGPA